MRPCNQCGAAISNRRLLCEPCEADAISKQVENPDSKPDAKQAPFDIMEIVYGAAEIVFRSLIVAVPFGLLGFLFFLIVAKPVYAVIAGMIFGVICGLGWTLVTMYFQGGPYHRK